MEVFKNEDVTSTLHIAGEQQASFTIHYGVSKVSSLYIYIISVY